MKDKYVFDHDSGAIWHRNVVLYSPDQVEDFLFSDGVCPAHCSSCHEVHDEFLETDKRGGECLSCERMDVTSILALVGLI